MRAIVAVALGAVVVCAATAAGPARSQVPYDPGAPPPAQVAAIVDARVTPSRAYFAGREIRIEFGLQAAAPVDVQVDVVRAATATVERRYTIVAASALERKRVVWDGLTGGGRVAPGGRYRVMVGLAGGAPQPAGELTFRGHVYPIRGPHSDRGPIGEFGTPRSGGRTHEGFDVDAPCATPVVAARGGRVVKATYDPVLYGNLVIVRGRKTHRDYWYAHLLRAPRVATGDRVTTGRRIGSIGATGNARTIGCHLHFEIRERDRPIDPKPELHAWDRWTPEP